MTTDLTWHTEKRKISDLVPYEKNPRRLTDKQSKDLKASLERFNLVEIPAIDLDNKIISGHQRLKILSQINANNGDTEIDVRVPNRKLTEQEFQEYNLRSNHNTGEWDFDLLAGFDKDLLIDVGFDDFELGEIFKDEIGLTDPDDVPETPAEPKIKTGELWLLGNHRLLCGDATRIEDMERLMDGKKADMVFTDPPYGVDYSAKNEFLNKFDKGNHIQRPIIKDKNSKEAFSLWGKAFGLMKNILSTPHSIYICSPQTRNLMMMMMMIEKVGGIHIGGIIVWVKNNHVLGRLDYHSKHEPIIYGWLKTGKHKFYGKGQFKTSVWNVDKPLKSDLHPTMKPIALIENALLNSSLSEQIIIDFFGGSGSTLIACEKLNRHCYMMEIEPHYIDVILERWAKFTGKDPIREDGVKWSELSL